MGNIVQILWWSKNFGAATAVVITRYTFWIRNVRHFWCNCFKFLTLFVFDMYSTYKKSLSYKYVENVFCLNRIYDRYTRCITSACICNSVHLPIFFPILYLLYFKRYKLSISITVGPGRVSSLFYMVLKCP